MKPSDSQMGGIGGRVGSLPDHKDDARRYLQEGQFEEAIVHFSKVRESDPEDIESWLGLGVSLAMNYQIYPAIDLLEALVTKHPSFVRGRIQLGLLYYRLCVTAKGREQMEKALASHPTSAERQTIWKLLREQKQLDKKRLYRPDFEALRRQHVSS